MGPYCMYCQHRCFVPRQIRNDGGDVVWDGLMATCTRGVEHDRAATGGWDFRTAYNPWNAASAA